MDINENDSESKDGLEWNANPNKKWTLLDLIELQYNTHAFTLVLIEVHYKEKINMIFFLLLVYHKKMIHLFGKMENIKNIMQYNKISEMH